MNQTTQIITITKDTSPLKIEFISPQANSVYNSSNIEIRLRANKLLSSATINGNPAIISADKIRINTNINLFSDGKYFFTAAVTDISGASATATIEFEIRSEASKSWTYEECSAELL